MDPDDPLGLQDRVEEVADLLLFLGGLDLLEGVQTHRALQGGSSRDRQHTCEDVSQGPSLQVSRNYGFSEARTHGTRETYLCCASLGLIVIKEVVEAGGNGGRRRVTWVSRARASAALESPRPAVPLKPAHMRYVGFCHTDLVTPLKSGSAARSPRCQSFLPSWRAHTEIRLLRSGPSSSTLKSATPCPRTTQRQQLTGLQLAVADRAEGVRV